MSNPGYSFVSVSTAKPGRLDDLIRIASAPCERMESRVPGMIARQVGVDRERNAVVVWATYVEKSDLYDFLASDEGQADHGDGNEIADIIESFEMCDLTPVSGRLPGDVPAA